MEAVVLCDNLIYDLHGPVVSKVASLLLYRGRLSFLQICRLSLGLKPDQVRAALIVLIQHNMCTYFCANKQKESDNKQGEAFYSVHVDEILARLWFGQFISMAEDVNRAWAIDQRHQAKEIIKTTLVHGKLRIGDLSRIAGERTSDDNDDGAVGSFQKTLTFLIQNHYLVPVSPAASLDSGDRATQLEETKLSEISSSTATKAKKQAVANAFQELRADVAEEHSELKRKALKAGLKRPRAPSTSPDPDQRASKKRRAVSPLPGMVGLDSDQEDNNEKENGDLSHLPYWQIVADDDVYVRVNYDRFKIRIRDKHIEKAVGDRFGPAARQVMRAISALSEDESRLRPEASDALQAAYSPTIMTHTILKKMRELLDSEKGGNSDIQNLLRDAFVSSSTVGSNVDSSGSWSPDKVTTISLVAEVCKRIAHFDEAEPSNESWLRRVESGMHEGPGEERWEVAYHAVNRSLKRALVTGIVHLRHQKEAVRVMRILDSYGRLDEKHVSKIGLIQPKETRHLIDTLMQAGIIELQEVPKTADRLPSRSFYLWYVDWGRVYNNLRNQMYQQLGNIRTRTRAEEARLHILRAKSQLPEVIEDKSALRDDEWEALQALDDRLRWLGIVSLRNVSDIGILDLKDVLVGEDAEA